MASAFTPRVGLALGAQALILGGLLTVALDQYAHKRVELLGGVNVRGYRGRVLPARQPGEIRLLYAGGSQAFGWGVAAGETTAAYLRHLVENALASRNHEGPITAANVAVLGLDAGGYAQQIDQYRYLQPELVCLHLDLTRSAGGPTMPPPSAVAALTGFTPILPTVLEEKARFGSGPAGRMLRQADRWLYGAVAGQPPATEPEAAASAAIDAALALAGHALVILPAPTSSQESAGHARLLAAIQPRVVADARLRLVDLSTHPTLSSPALRIDGTNLGAGGHSAEALAILPAALELLLAAGHPITK